MRLRTMSLFFLPALWALGAIATACVGDDPVPTIGTQDADGSSGQSEDSGAEGPADVTSTDVEARHCAWNEPFGSAKPLDPADDIERDWPTLTDDERTMFFAYGEAGDKRIYTVTRASRAEEFDFRAESDVVDVNAGGDAYAPFLTEQGRVLYYYVGKGEAALWRAERDDSGKISKATMVRQYRNGGGPSSFTETTNPIEVYSERYIRVDGGVDKEDLYRSTVNDAGFSDAEAIAPLNAAASSESAPFISKDGLTLYFSSDRNPTAGRGDLWVTRRDNLDFGEPERLQGVNTSADEAGGVWVSPDGCRIYFTRTRDGHRHLYFAER